MGMRSPNQLSECEVRVMGSETKVLVVGMLDSVHLARWLQHFIDSDISFLLFPSSPQRRLHPDLENLLTAELSSSFRLIPGARWLGLPLWAIDRFFDNFFRSTLLSIIAKSFRPHFVHALEFQNAGYVVSKAFSKMSAKTPVLIGTNYGSDIFWFARKARHARKLSRLLNKLDRYAAECHRDVKLAKSLGFEGRVMPVRPNAGGFSSAELARSLIDSKDRKLIMVKGYHGWVGRAHIALQALESISAELQDYEIVVYSCNLSTKRLATQVAKRTGLTITAYSKGALTHDEMVEKFSRSLIYIGLSLSDGISTSMLEAMAMGAVPVQTSTACCDEWFSETGVAIHNLDAEEVSQGIRRAIDLALTTDSAAKNRETIRARASREEIAKQALAFYQL